jgi:tetratricopeptide (TPR) repeat protein
MILDALIVFATATAMILGVLYLRWKGTNRFFSRRTIRMIFSVEIAVILIASAFLYVPARVPCLVDILVCRYRDGYSTHHNTKMTALASEVIRLAPETDWNFSWAHGIRANMNLRERKYDEAIADFDVALRLHPVPEGDYVKFYYNPRGEAKFALGDYAGALEDFDMVFRCSGSSWNNHYYNRGFAHEKLGNFDLALADYDRAIAHMKQFQEPSPVVTNTARPGYDDESRRKIHRWEFGYAITLEELIEIRDRVERRWQQE